MARGAVLLVTVLATLALSTFSPVTPAAADPVYIGWASLLPPVPGAPAPPPTGDDSLTVACRKGLPNCVQGTISLIQSQLDGFAAACDHKAVFSLAYLRTTQAYQNVASIGGYFNDVTWVNREDAIFAGYYFTALADWQQGNSAAVPAAWRIAFDAAEKREVSGSGDLLLGMNAHVNRDLPFVLAGLGLVTPNGQSRKPDHDKIDQMLNGVMQPLLAEESQRFDPTILSITTPFGVGYTGLLQLLVAWREAAWRNAELLVTAPDDASRALVVASIEDAAAASAQTIRTTNAFVPPVTSTQARDAFCAAHR